MTGPPRIARWIVARATPATYRASLLADLDDEFALQERAVGVTRARRWYRAQVAASIVPLLGRWLLGRSAPRPLAPTGASMRFDLADDLRHAARIAKRTPLTTATVLVTMIVGLGATAAVYSLADALLLKPLPFAGSERVVRLGTHLPGGSEFSYVVYPDLVDYRRDVRGFSDVSAFAVTGGTALFDGKPVNVRVANVEDSFQRILAMRPLHGRLLAPGEFSGGARVVVLTHAFWREQLGGDPSVVGRTILIDDQPQTVVGVLEPMTFMYPEQQVAMFAPLFVDPRSGAMGRMCHCYMAIAQLRVGTPLETAAREARLMANRIADEYAGTRSRTVPTFTPLRDAVVGNARQMVLLLAAAVAAVLLIASLNVASLLLGKAEGRSREFAVRAAIGGSAPRIVRQLFTESLALSFVGGAIGLLIAPVLAKALVALYPGALPRANEITINSRVALAAALASLVAGIVAGVPMIRRVLRANLSERLRDGGRGGQTRRQRRIAQSMVGAQVALSVALLFAAGVLVQTFRHLSTTDPGFAAREGFSFYIYAPPARYADSVTVDRFFETLERALRTTPGVREVGYSSFIPFRGGLNRDKFIVEENGDRGLENPTAVVSSASPGYMRALSATLASGRDFSRDDAAGAPRVVLINQALADRQYAGVDPVGRYIRFHGGEHRRIVGIVRNVHETSLDLAPEPQLILPFAQDPSRGRYVMIRSDAPPAAVRDAVTRVVAALDPGIVATAFRPMDELVATAVAPQRFRAVLVAALGAVAVLLAAIGIYGTVGQAVARQTREIGIRMALGEEATRVRRRVVGSALLVSSGGAAVGAVLALGAGRWLSTMIVGVSAHDGSLLVLAAGSLVLVAAAAAYAPARRASRVDPLVALRAE